MGGAVMEDNVNQLMRLLPAGYENASHETGAMRRASGVVREPKCVYLRGEKC
jgi:hypothetical protein